MATRKQKQELISALKFTPREVSIMLSGYGGEIAMGRISEAAYDYWRDRGDELSDYAYDWDQDMEVPAEARIFEAGSWYDCDDICHENGVELGDPCRITVTDDLETTEIWESTLDITVLVDQGVTVEQSGVTDFDEDQETQYVFQGQNIEKGVFFDGKIRITQPFDPRLLTISYYDCDGWRLVTGVQYDGEDVEGTDGYSTNGKGSEFKVFEINRDDEDLSDIDVLEGEEMWASEAIDTADEVQRWEGHELTPWWPVTEKPVRPGRYQVILGTWPFPSFAEYSKKTGWTDRGDKIEDVKSWRGLREPAE